ncbi:hypothetical protein BMS3Abin10_01993 [bacterium BMS3Abin10]|nr:hypothetical protein BMS3Abin10_01993 [bacterium BMS3Abin10]
MTEKRKLNTKAIVIGWLVDTGGTFIAGIIIAILTTAFMAAQGVGADQIPDKLAGSKAFLNLSLFIGFSFTFIGGFVAAFIAKEEETRHAFAVGVLSLAVSFIFTIMMTTDPKGFLLLIFIIPFAMLGGYLRKITKKENKTEKQS